MIDESSIVQFIINRNEKGLSILYDKYAPALMGVINRIVNDKLEAEDLLSQTMLKVWNKIELYDNSKSSLFTWVMTIARNTAIDKKRLKSFENHKKTDSLDATVYEIVGTNDFNSKLDVQSLTLKLDSKYKLVLDMMYLQGYSQLDISKKMDIPLGTVKTRLRKAIQILREELKDEKEEFLGMILFLIYLMFKLV